MSITQDNIAKREVLIEKLYTTIEIKNDVNFGEWWLCEQHKGKKFQVTPTTIIVAKRMGYYSNLQKEGILYVTVDSVDNINYQKAKLIIPKRFCKYKLK